MSVHHQNQDWVLNLQASHIRIILLKNREARSVLIATTANSNKQMNIKIALYC